MPAAFKPMLAGTAETLDIIKLPVLVSAKLDGFRAIKLNGQLVGRKLEPIPNPWIQEQFRGLPEGLDGELLIGDPRAGTAWNATSKGMAEGARPEDVRFWAFDWHGSSYEGATGYEARYMALQNLFDVNRHVAWRRRAELVTHYHVKALDYLATLEERLVNEGYEGIMIRSLNGPYKYGRSTELEGHLLKHKRWFESEAVVYGYEEEMENRNPLMRDKLGHAKRATVKANKVGKGVMGKFLVRWRNPKGDLVETSIAPGTADEAGDFWARRDQLIGAIVTFKYCGVTIHGKPRYPIFKGVRPAFDQPAGVEQFAVTSAGGEE